MQDKGGILITQDDIEIAFKILDRARSGKVGLGGLGSRLKAFFPTMTDEEVAFVMGDEKYITRGFLSDLLLDNTVTNFDPVEAAFKAFDPEGRGYLDATALKAVFSKLGLGTLSDEDITILTDVTAGKAAGGGHHHVHVSKDGKGDKSGAGAASAVPEGRRISLEDFRLLLGKTRQRPPTDEEMGRQKEEY